MERPRRLEMLRAHPLFAGVDAARLEALADIAEPVSVENGRAFIVEGDRDGNFFYVVSGRARVVKRLGDGGEKDLAVVGSGEALGEMELLRESTRSASVRADGPLELLKLDSGKFRGWLSADPASAARFYAALAERQSSRLRRTSDEVALLYDLSEILVQGDLAPATLLSDALRRVTPHLAGSWSAEARHHNPFNEELDLVARVGAAQSPDGPVPAPNPDPGSLWTDSRTRRLALSSPQALLAVLTFRAGVELDDASRAEAERVLVGAARLLTAALENSAHRTDAALRERLRSQSHAPRV